MFNTRNQIKKNIYNYIYKNLSNNVGPKKYFIIFLFTFWASLWLSIGSQPNSLKLFGNSFIDNINAIRIAIPLLLSILTTAILVYLIFKEKNFDKIHHLFLIFYIFFFFQIIGLIFNNDVNFTLGNSYLILLAIGSLNILLIIKILRFDFLAKILLYSSILICILFLIFFIFKNLDKFNESLLVSNFYSISKPGDLFMGFAQPRSTGLARIFSVVTIALIIFNERLSHVHYKILLTFIIFSCSTIIWGFQSRGAIICFYTTVIFIFFYFDYKNKLKKFLLYLIVPIIFFNFLSFASQYYELTVNQKKEVLESESVKDNALQNKSDSEKKKLKSDEQKKYNKQIEIQNRFIKHGLKTSGRVEIWKYALNKFDSKKIFGYGPQGDRYILSKKYEEYGNNSSNVLLYSLLSGGYFAVLIILVIFLWFINILFKEKIIFRKNTIAYPENLKISIALIFFFYMRGLIENSFSLFSIDYLLTLISIYIVNDNFKKV